MSGIHSLKNNRITILFYNQILRNEKFEQFSKNCDAESVDEALNNSHPACSLSAYKLFFNLCCVHLKKRIFFTWMDLNDCWFVIESRNGGPHIGLTCMIHVNVVQYSYTMGVQLHVGETAKYYVNVMAVAQTIVLRINHYFLSILTLHNTSTNKF